MSEGQGMNVHGSDSEDLIRIGNSRMIRLLGMRYASQMTVTCMTDIQREPLSSRSVPSHGTYEMSRMKQGLPEHSVIFRMIREVQIHRIASAIGMTAHHVPGLSSPMSDAQDRIGRMNPSDAGRVRNRNEFARLVALARMIQYRNVSELRRVRNRY